jgi:hypothetical protein
MIGEEEISAQCPYCGSPISFLCEQYAGAQAYVEDCEVCCRPIHIAFEVDDDEGITSFHARRLND